MTARFGQFRDVTPRVEPERTTPARFRVEPLEPRLLLSGDPLDLLKDLHAASVLPEPAVAVDDTHDATPTIDWGAAPETPPAAEHAAVDSTTVADAAAQISAPSTTVASTDEARVVAPADSPASHAADAPAARGPPARDDYTAFTFQEQDDGGTASGAVDLDPTPSTLAIDVLAVNDAPQGTSTTVTTLEDTPYVFATADFGFSDAGDTPPNQLLAVRLTTLPGPGVLTLAGGPAPVAGDVVSATDIAAGGLRFLPATDAHGLAHASFTFQVQDDGGTADGGVDLDPTPRTLTIDVVSVNDAPQSGSRSVTALEDTPFTFSVGAFGFRDPKDSPANAFQAVKLTTLPTAGTLSVTGAAPLVAGDFVSVADIAAGKLRFTPAANASSLDYATFTFQVQDNGGTVNDGVDLDPTARTMTIDVLAVNDAPQGTSATVTTLEDTPYVFTIADFGFGDPADSPANAFAAVKLTTLPTAGILSLTGGAALTAGDLLTATDIAAGRLRFAPFTDDHGAGYASFTFQVQDDGGTANGGVDLDPTPRTLTIDVVSVNDAPESGSRSVTALEDTAFTFAPGTFGFIDPKDTPPNAFLAVKLTTLPTAGALTLLGGAPLSAGEFVAVADLTAGRLRFTAAANASGLEYATFTFQVQDNGGTANGGVDLDPTPRTMAIDVTPVNDAPQGAAHTVSTRQDTAYVFTPADFGFSDPSDSPANALQAVKITTLPTAGTLSVVGAPVLSAGAFVSAADIAAGKLLFTPAAGAAGTPYATFTFQVQDAGGTANGGVDLDPTPRTMTADVTAENAAPAFTAVAATAAVDENGIVTLTGAFTDPDADETLTLLVDWGEGAPETIPLVAGARDFHATHRYLDDNPTGTPLDVYTIRLTLRDHAGTTATAETSTRVNDVAPTVTLTAPALGLRGVALDFTGRFADPGTLDTFEVAWDFGDGTVIAFHPSTDAAALTPTHAYATGGQFTVTLRVRDDDGGVGVVTRTIVISTVVLQPDIRDPRKTELIVLGTDADDEIRIVQVGDGGRCDDGRSDRGVEVRINGQSLGVFHPTSRVVVYGLAGNDDIEADADLRLTMEFYGGPGHDRLKGGAGNDVLVGGAGHDLLVGRGGRDILTGGEGADWLIGGPGGTLLIAGSTIHDEDRHALAALAAEWTRTDVSYATRIEHLTGGGGLNDGIRLTAATVHSDGALDILAGGWGWDWFITERRDALIDRHPWERVLVTDPAPPPFWCRLFWPFAGR